jgi:hypothetical protein
LLQHLPVGQQSVDQLEATVRSAQFQQSLGSLDHALRQADSFQQVTANFNLNPAAGADQLARGDGVGAFLVAVQASTAATENPVTPAPSTAHHEHDEEKEDNMDTE